MRLSELLKYAEEKYQIKEQYKWSDLPAFSVLIDPVTQKWAALLMRQWDHDAGEEIELCDIKCGRKGLTEAEKAVICRPFRMHGENWVGVRLDENTDPGTVLALFDRAMRPDTLYGFTVVLNDDRPEVRSGYRESEIKFDKPFYSSDKEIIPERILGMMKLYSYGDGSFRQRCRMFYLQGRYMEDYEDDFEWKGVFRRYFTTYHDLRTDQLRGYFTWRTKVRHGKFEPVSLSFAYIYLYELLNGIGSASPEDSIKKLKEFESGFIDHGMGDEIMRKNIRRWMLDLAILNGVSPDIARGCISPEQLKKDDAASVLHTPEKHDVDEIFDALCVFGGKKISDSLLIKKAGQEAKRLFAAVWLYAVEQYKRDGCDLFRDIFGEQMEFLRRPFENAVYYNEHPSADAYYEINGCRSFICRNGVWKERCYHILSFDKKLFESFLRETERKLRIYLKAGHHLTEKREDVWASRFADFVIKRDEHEKIEAKKPKITIRFDDLDRIREDSVQTRDSLLTDEEKDGNKEESISADTASPDAGEDDSTSSSGLLNKEQTLILKILLKGGSVKETLRSMNVMAEVFADSLNEALFDEIGDTAVECDGEDIYLVEDYREDIVRMLGV